MTLVLWSFLVHRSCLIVKD
ncbi:unnamed protein product [Spirodela intermedia]|uniref:Uncharacterized protein n=2 Tax=Spirodela intermedia TaxID=51605 RepID=A0A7I8J4C0_SPIIN|nr:unnamed protein product [Spirodela intermedia]CAA6664894.1 unnamed protein product [Spirodela intermedia]CAA7401531.1 unnamed protein product [Spirodela intermedia]